MLQERKWESQIQGLGLLCPHPQVPPWGGSSRDLGSLLVVARAPESEGKHSWGRILVRKACMDDLALILDNTENTRNILYNPLRIFLLQLRVTSLER